MEYKKTNDRSSRSAIRIGLRTAAFLVALASFFTLIFIINQRRGKDLTLDETRAVDLTSWDFASKGRNYINSEWQFYPDQLLTPQDFEENSSNRDNSLPRFDSSTIPHFSGVTLSTSGWENLGPSAVWSVKSGNPPRMGAYGCGTYRIVMKVSDYQDIVAMDFPEISQAARIWVNGRLLGSTGKISYSPDGYEADMSSLNISFMPSLTGHIEIIIACSNFSETHGGIICSPAIGTVTQIDNLYAIPKMWMAGVFTLLLLIVITGFYGSLTFENRNKFFYFIAMISLALAYEIFDTSFNPLPDSWNILLQTTCYLLLTLASVLYFHRMYPRDNAFPIDRLKDADIIVVAAGVAVFLAVFWIQPQFLHTAAGTSSYTAFITIANLLMLIRVFYMAVRHPEYGSFQIVSARMMASVFSTMQVVSQQVYSIPLHSVGIVLMIFGTAFYFTARYVRNFNRASRFTLELEQAVQDKTRNIAKVNAELVDANKKLLENEDARKRMMSNVSHDLRTPITAIRGYVELLINSGYMITEEMHQTYLKNMHVRCLQIEQMIEELMQLTRLESGGFNLNIQTLSVSEIIENLYDLYETECRHAGRTLLMELPENDPLNVLGDPNNLIRVFDNLIVNAIRYTSENGHIIIRAVRETTAGNSENIHILVKDDGFGIPSSEIPYVFDRFYRASNSAGVKNGSGLGLAIVKSIVEKHKGKVWVESGENPGSTFHVLLPANKKS